MLDLFLTNLSHAVSTEVHAGVSDHSMVLARLQLDVPGTEEIPRKCFISKEARWDDLKDFFASVDWKFMLSNLDPDAATKTFTDYVLSTAKKFIPFRLVQTYKSSHPWLNDICKELVAKKRAAFGTLGYQVRQAECSAGLLREYSKYVERTKLKLSLLPRGSKSWWKISQTLMMRTQENTSIPPLKNEEGKWVLSVGEKANLFADTFHAKSTLPEAQENEYSPIPVCDSKMSGFPPIR